MPLPQRNKDFVIAQVTWSPCKGFASFERYPKLADGTSIGPRVLTTRKCVGLHKGSIRSMGACEWESTEYIYKSFLLKCQPKNVGLNGLIGCLHKMVSPLNTEVLIRGASSNGRPFVLGFIWSSGNLPREREKFDEGIKSWKIRDIHPPCTGKESGYIVGLSCVHIYLKYNK